MMELKEPKRKRSSGKVRQTQSLPLIIESVSGISACSSLWPVYIGTFSGDSVTISSRDEMSSLYNMGFFGKGCLSRGYPSFGEIKKGIPPFIRERQWKCRKLWMEQLLSFAGSSYLEKLKGWTDGKCNHNKDGEKQSQEKTQTEDGGESVLSNKDEPVVVIDSESDENFEKDDSEQTSKCNKKRKTNDSNSICQTDDKTTEKPESTTFDKSTDLKNVDMRSELIKNGNGGTKENLLPLLEENTNDSNYSIVVIDDSGSDDESQLTLPRPRLCDEPVKTSAETLNLTLEEAFFLSFGLGCLQVIDLQGVFLTLQGMWQLFRESQPGFISSYVTYHYFRAKGWIVKPGTKFGGNFLLYKQGPPFYHASYVVLIEEVNNKFDNAAGRKLTWTKIMGLNRVAETAGKEILQCQVVWPLEVTEEDASNPKIISKFKVQEVLYRRWNSSQERDKD